MFKQCDIYRGNRHWMLDKWLRVVGVFSLRLHDDEPCCHLFRSVSVMLRCTHNGWKSVLPQIMTIRWYLVKRHLLFSSVARRDSINYRVTPIFFTIIESIIFRFSVRSHKPSFNYKPAQAYVVVCFWFIEFWDQFTACGSHKRCISPKTSFFNDISGKWSIPFSKSFSVLITKKSTLH